MLCDVAEKNTEWSVEDGMPDDMLDSKEEITDENIDQEAKSELAKQIVAEVGKDNVDDNGEKNEEPWDEYGEGVEDVGEGFLRCWQLAIADHVAWPHTEVTEWVIIIILVVRVILAGQVWERNTELQGGVGRLLAVIKVHLTKSSISTVH